MTYNPKEMQWHDDALAHLENGGTARDPDYPKIWNDTAMTGTYAYRPSKSEPPKAVFFFYSTKEEGKLLCRINNEPVKYGLDIWRSCATRPISRDAYDDFIEKGVWPSEILVTLTDGTVDSSMTDTRGHNSGVVTGATKHKDDIAEWVEKAKKLIKLGAPKTKAEADTLADAKTKLADLIADADKERESITKPLFRAYKDANEEWSSFLTPAQGYLAPLDQLIRGFIRTEQKRREDEARKINEAAAEAAAAEEAGKRGGGTIEARTAPEHNPLGIGTAPTVQAVAVTVGTRKTIKAAKRRVVVFEDFKKTAAYFASLDPPPPDLVKLISDKAMALLSQTVPVPGAKLDMETVGK